MSVTSSAQAFSLQLKPIERSIPEVPAREKPRTLPKSDAEWNQLLGSTSPATHKDPFEDELDQKVFGLSPPPKYTPGVQPKTLDVIVIGAGLSGMIFSMKSRWELHKVNIRILEKNPTFGGTWFENRYPGCRCDVASVLYSFRFEPFDWTEGYPQWDEIYQYFRYIAVKYNVLEHVEFNTNVSSNTWDEDKAKWIIEVERGRGQDKKLEVLSCDVCVNANGLLNRPKLPDIPGIETYRGHLVHSSQWNPKVDIPDGKRVGVIGNGSTGIQIASEIARKVAKLDHFCRTPTWITPYPHNYNVDRAFRDKMMRLENHHRNQLEAWIMGERSWVWFANENYAPVAKRYQDQLLRIPQKNLETCIKDPSLRARMTPHHAWGCRRPIWSNTYYDAIQLPTSTYVDDPIMRFSERGLVVRKKDGTEEERQLDMVICASGFAVNWVNKFMPVRGKNGRLLADTWATHPEAYRSLCVHGFPNYFWVAGPNTPPTHNSVYIIFEQQINYIFQVIVFLQHNPVIKSVEVKLSAQKEFADKSQEWLRKNTVFNEDCGGWYRYKNGYIVQWPGSATHMMESIYAPDWDHFDLKIEFDRSSLGPRTPMSASGWVDRWRDPGLKHLQPVLPPKL